MVRIHRNDGFTLKNASKTFGSSAHTDYLGQEWSPDVTEEIKSLTGT